MPITQRDIAELSGVSKATVSYVLNGKDHLVGSTTRRRVWDAIQRLGYRPNSAAKAIVSGSFGTVALLLSTSHYFSFLPWQLLDGIQDELAQHELHLSIAKLSDEIFTTPHPTPKVLRQSMVDGYLINYTHRIPKGLIELIGQHDIPAVWINTQQTHNCVYPDDEQGGRMITEHFLELGHKKIAYLDYSHDPGAMETSHYSAQARYKGYAQTMQKAGLTPRMLWREKPQEKGPRFAIMRSWMTGEDRPTAVITYSDQIDVTNIFIMAGQLGLRIPQDLSVAVFANQAMTLADLSLTTALVPQYEVGKTAVDTLRERIARPGQMASRGVAFTLHAGQTAVRV